MGYLASNLDMGAIRRFFSPHMGLWVLTMIRRGKKGPQVIYKYFNDLVHENVLKAPQGPYKKDI
jgi:hypothetical protein